MALRGDGVSRHANPAASPPASPDFRHVDGTQPHLHPALAGQSVTIIDADDGTDEHSRRKHHGNSRKPFQRGITRSRSPRSVRSGDLEAHKLGTAARCPLRTTNIYLRPAFISAALLALTPFQPILPRAPALLHQDVRYAALVSLFEQWRTFQHPVLLDGVLDDCDAGMALKASASPLISNELLAE